MTDAEKLAARDRFYSLRRRLDAAMKMRWRETLVDLDRERLLDIAASKIHECRVLSQRNHELSGFKHVFGGEFTTAAFEIAVIRNAASSDGEVLALGIQAEVRSENAKLAAKVKAAPKEAIFEAALAKYRESPSLNMKNVGDRYKVPAGLAASRLIRDNGYKISAEILARRISTERSKK